MGVRHQMEMARQFCRTRRWQRPRPRIGRGRAIQPSQAAWDTFPSRAARYCLESAQIEWEDLDVVAIGWDLPRIRSWGDSDRQLLYSALSGRETVANNGPELRFVDHHLAHALSAFHASGFDRAGILVVDGSGEYEAISIYQADRNSGLRLKRRWPRSYSLGSMYKAATRLLGFGYLDAGKTMGLAPYGMGGSSLLLPFGDFVSNGTSHSKPLEVPSTAHYTTFTDKWMSYLSNRFGPVTSKGGDLASDLVALRVALNAQRTVEEALRAFLRRRYASPTAWTSALQGASH